MTHLLFLIAAFSQVRPPEHILANGARVEQIVFGTRFAVGPVWIEQIGLTWSDPIGNGISSWRKGVTTQISKGGNHPYGRTCDAQGRLLACEMKSHSIVRSEPDGRTKTLVDSYQGKRLNGPLDLVVWQDGTIYFTDPQLKGGPTKPELDFSGVFRLSTDGAVTVVARDLAMPNGICFSNDRKKAYVTDSTRHCIRSYDVAPDGSFQSSSLFAYLTGELPGAAAGLKVDRKGNVYCAGPGGVQVFDSSGKYLGLIFVKDVVTNFCFGDSDRKTLYISAAHGIYRIRLLNAG
ncbi:MAG: SMP-30/gluconolactonase/LRE family protein [Fimbriimonas sp.]|nr:SMP-30/gluconolactonase/LRE family protein [Fimbriimonas sp.]